VLDRQRSRTAPALIVGVTIGMIVLIAFAVRFAFIDQVSADYRSFVSPWYDYLSTHDGFAAVGTDIANYNPPYLYLLAAVSYLPLPKIVAIKLISMVFDVALAGFAALVVRERFGRPVIWLSCFAVVLFAPTVLINSSYWGQCDSIYAAFCLGSLYFLLRRQPWWACVFFGLALSFKLQAIFFLPVLIIVLVVNKQRLLALLAVPATFVLMLVPAALAGRDWSSLLMIYPDQVTTGGTGGGVGTGTGTGGFGTGGAPGGGGRGRGQTTGALGGLTQNAPTFYQWVGGSTVWTYLGLAAAAVVAIFAAGLAFFRRRPLTTPAIVVLATTLVLAVPFFLPEMHERYFYLADVLTIVAAFYVRRYWVVAVVVSACSLLSYAPFLWQRTFVPLPLVAFAEFLAVIATLLVFWNVVGGDGRWLRRAPVAHGVDRPDEVSQLRR
jgi:Gpi18-like mannosyltransferase